MENNQELCLGSKMKVMDKMTIIKQTSVAGAGHEKNLRNYINNDEKVLLRDSLNMEGCSNLKRWASYMWRTREQFGHNESSRKGRDGKPAKNTVLYHQILGFNPDECDLNGGSLKPEDCMRYAREYAKVNYPHQQIVFVVHNEYCRQDKTHRYAVHMVINRSDLVTGKRLNEGRGQTAKVARASRVRQMDERWSLKQVEEGKQNSRVHKKQFSKASHVEKVLTEEGRPSYKMNLRELCRLAGTKAQNIVEYRELLESWGVNTEFRRGRMYVKDTDNAKYSFSIVKLDDGFNPEGLKEAFRQNATSAVQETKVPTTGHGRAVEHDPEQTRNLKLTRDYLVEIRETYQKYRKTAHSMQGAPLNEIPKFKLKRPPAEVANDPEVRRLVMAYWRGGDELRAKMASNVPRAKKRSGTTGNSGTTPKSSQQPERGARDGRRGDNARG